MVPYWGCGCGSCFLGNGAPVWAVEGWFPPPVVPGVVYLLAVARSCVGLFFAPSPVHVAPGHAWESSSREVRVLGLPVAAHVPVPVNVAFEFTARTPPHLVRVARATDERVFFRMDRQRTDRLLVVRQCDTALARGKIPQLDQPSPVLHAARDELGFRLLRIQTRHRVLVPGQRLQHHVS